MFLLVQGRRHIDYTCPQGSLWITLVYDSPGDHAELGTQLRHLRGSARLWQYGQMNVEPGFVSKNVIHMILGSLCHSSIATSSATTRCRLVLSASRCLQEDPSRRRRCQCAHCPRRRPACFFLLLGHSFAIDANRDLVMSVPSGPQYRADRARPTCTLPASFPAETPAGAEVGM